MRRVVEVSLDVTSDIITRRAYHRRMPVDTVSVYDRLCVTQKPECVRERRGERER